MTQPRGRATAWVPNVWSLAPPLLQPPSPLPAEGGGRRARRALGCSRVRHLRVHRLAPHTAPTTAAAAPPSPRARRRAHKDWTHLERVARTELELTQHDDERALDDELELIQHLCPPAFAAAASRCSAGAEPRRTRVVLRERAPGLLRGRLRHEHAQWAARYSRFVQSPFQRRRGACAPTTAAAEASVCTRLARRGSRRSADTTRWDDDLLRRT